MSRPSLLKIFVPVQLLTNYITDLAGLGFSSLKDLPQWLWGFSVGGWSSTGLTLLYVSLKLSSNKLCLLTSSRAF